LPKRRRDERWRCPEAAANESRRASSRRENAKKGRYRVGVGLDA
jgi:hypothetical protein